MLMAGEGDRPPISRHDRIRIFQWTLFNFERDRLPRARPSPLSLSRYSKSRNGPPRCSIWHCELFDGLSCRRCCCSRAVVFLFEWTDELKYPIGLKLRAKLNKCGSILFCSLFAATKGFFNRKYIAKYLQSTTSRLRSERT